MKNPASRRSQFWTTIVAGISDRAAIDALVRLAGTSRELSVLPVGEVLKEVLIDLIDVAPVAPRLAHACVMGLFYSLR